MQILPFYLLCDESSSMEGDRIGTINAALPELHQEISVNPRVSDKAHFGVVAFNTSAWVRLALSDLSDVVEMPELVAQGTTNYTAAFDLMHDTIEKDVRRLKSLQHTVYRPVVFFLTDGVPTDGQGHLDEMNSWTAAHDALVSPDFLAHPNIVAFGIGECDADIIRRVATFKAFVQNEDAMSPAAALKEFAASLCRSIIMSVSRNDVMAEPQLIVDDHLPGFSSLRLDTLLWLRWGRGFAPCGPSGMENRRNRRARLAMLPQSRKPNPPRLTPSPRNQ